MRPITRANAPVAPATTVSAAATRNAPTALRSEMPCVDAIRAAPGVDQAVSTGRRNHRAKPMQVMPMPMPSAHSHEVVSAGVAPTARAAWKTMATELE
jgi:hypothetical protein